MHTPAAAERHGEIMFDVGAVRTLIVAGWTGRKADDVERHIRELEAIGVRRPEHVPTFYQLTPSLLTTAPIVEAPPETSAGEAEAVFVALESGLYVGVGSDHTDRQMETTDVTAAKQACAKPVAAHLWRYDDVAPHWDSLELRSFLESAGRRRDHQRGTVEALLPPRDLIARFEATVGPFAPGVVLFGGTLPALGPLEPADWFEIELTDPVLRRTLRHRYRVQA